METKEQTQQEQLDAARKRQKYIKNHQAVVQHCQKFVYASIGIFEFFTRVINGVEHIGYKRKNFKGFLLEGVSFIPIIMRPKVDAWERRVGLHSGN